jgi:hypothetical protein
MGRELIMKRFMIVMLFIFIASVNVNGQEGYLMQVKQPVDSNQIEKKSSRSLIEEMDIPDSNHIDTFADAFNDPNIVIGVFEDVLTLGIYERLTPDERKTLTQGLMVASNFNLSPLYLIKSIKGKFANSIIFIKRQGTFDEHAPRVNIAPGSKWIFALRKTTKDYRIERWGNEMEKYEFLNDDTVFIEFRYGYGALCLKWPKQEESIFSATPSSFNILFKEPEDLVKVPESMVEDLETIQKVMPTLKKEIKDSNDTAEIAKTSQALKNDLAKSIYSKIPKEKKKQELEFRGEYRGISN